MYLLLDLSYCAKMSGDSGLLYVVVPSLHPQGMLLRWRGYIHGSGDAVPPESQVLTMA